MNASRDKEQKVLSISDQMDEPVRPLVWISSGLAIGAFLFLFAFGTSNPDNWFAKKFLSRNGLVLVAVLLLVLNAVTISLLERYLNKRKSAARSDQLGE